MAELRDQKRELSYPKKNLSWGAIYPRVVWRRVNKKKGGQGVTRKRPGCGHVNHGYGRRENHNHLAKAWSDSNKKRD